MTILPTLEGGLSIQPESDADWEVLEMITRDIGRSGRLAESLGGLMDDESEWDEWVVPDLEFDFGEQRTYVDDALRDARELAVPELSITPKDVSYWYGAVNQARLGLEARYQLDKLESLDGVLEERIQAYYRDRFYTTLLSLFLEYVMDV